MKLCGSWNSWDHSAPPRTNHNLKNSSSPRVSSSTLRSRSSISGTATRCKSSKYSNSTPKSSPSSSSSPSPAFRISRVTIFLRNPACSEDHPAAITLNQELPSKEWIPESVASRRLLKRQELWWRTTGEPLRKSNHNCLKWVSTPMRQLSQLFTTKDRGQDRPNLKDQRQGTCTRYR